MEKYYLNQRAAHDVTSGGYTFHFEQVCMIGSSVWGVLKTSDEKEQAALEKLFSSGVKEISLADYTIYVKKKNISMMSLPLQKPQSSPLPQAPRAAPAPVATEKVEHDLAEVAATGAAAEVFVSNKDDLAAALGLKATDKAFKTLWDNKDAPTKMDQGYNVTAWKLFATGHGNS